jgi:hypothetical protein
MKSCVVIATAITQGLVACSSGDNEANSLSTGGTTSVVLGSGGTTSSGLGGTNNLASNTGVSFGGATGGVSVLGGTAMGGATVGVSASGGTAMGGATVGVSASGGTAMGGATGVIGTGSGGRSSFGGASTGGRTSSGSSVATGGTSSGSTVTDCPETGHVSYTLAKVASPTIEQTTAYDKITAAMDKATVYYNCYTNITKVLNVSYVPSVATADGNINGSIRFGSTASMNQVTAMHEISHTVGVGTASNWASFLSNGTFTGTNALTQLRAIAPSEDAVHADNSHFWPYGLNYESEGKTEADLVGHCKMVMAIRKDLGLK